MYYSKTIIDIGKLKRNVIITDLIHMWFNNDAVHWLLKEFWVSKYFHISLIFAPA